jgi:hypothetical protein
MFIEFIGMASPPLWLKAASFVTASGVEGIGEMWFGSQTPPSSPGTEKPLSSPASSPPPELLAPEELAPEELAPELLSPDEPPELKPELEPPSLFVLGKPPELSSPVLAAQAMKVVATTATMEASRIGWGR